MQESYINWAIHTLNIKGYKIQNTIPEIVQDTAWSKVFRFTTASGFIFLKKVPVALSIEAKVINILSEKFKAPVPLVISDNQDVCCFLMKDAGVRLYDYFNKQFELDILINAMHDYTQIQMKACDRVNLFLDIGVPDWRLEKLPYLYQELISHEELLIEDGVKSDELIKLKKLAPKLFSICEDLSSYKIRDTFGHADFHDKNILIDENTKQTTLIDLGEVVITHPFFSFLNCLHRAKENFSLSDTQYQKLQIECFKPWLQLETQTHLFEILSLIQQCWSIHSVLGEFRLINSVDYLDSEKLKKEGRLANTLRYWINQ